MTGIGGTTILVLIDTVEIEVEVDREIVSGGSGGEPRRSYEIMKPEL